MIRRSPDQMPQSEEEYWQPARYDSRCRTPKLADPTQSLRLQQPPVAARQGALGRHSRRFRERSPFLSKRRLGRRWAGSSKPCRTLSQKRSKSSRPRTEESMSCRFHPSRPPEHGPGCGLHVGGGLIGDAVLLVVSSRRSKLLVTAADLGWRPLRPVLHPYVCSDKPKRTILVRWKTTPPPPPPPPFPTPPWPCGAVNNKHRGACRN